MMARAPVVVDAEVAPPEADRLAEFPHPRAVPLLHGQAPAERALLEAYAGGRLHHAWLLAGPEGVGKATLAYRFARFMFARPEPAAVRAAADLTVSQDSPAFRQVAALAHPNLLVLRRAWNEKTERLGVSISVDEVRRLRGFLGTTAAAGPWRAVIVDRAEEMNVNAANALLKSLEEPPPRTVFMLVTAAPGRLPATIRSRCRTLALHPLGPEDLRAAVTDALRGADMEEPGGAELATAIPLAQGSVRHALQLLMGGGADLHGRLLAVLDSLPRLDAGAAHALADRVAGRGQESEFDMLFTLLEDLLARLVHAVATGEALASEESALGARLMPAHGLARWAELWEEVRRAKADALALNLDRKNLVLGIFFRFEETARAMSARSV